MAVKRNLAGLYTGDGNGPGVRIWHTWIGAIEVAVTNGNSLMGHRINAEECREIAAYLLEVADEVEAEATNAKIAPAADVTVSSGG